MNHYQELIRKLDQFIRKFYFNQLLRGLLLFILGVGAMVLLLSLSEYFLYLPAFIKISVLVLIALCCLWALIFWIIKPLLGMQKIGKVINREQAATIVGQFFPEVSDKLLNILQLKERPQPGESMELALAGIEQKSSQLSVVPIPNAVDLKGNLKYLKWLLPLLAVLGLIALFSPQIYKEAASRWTQPTKTFYRPAPFQFAIVNKQLEVPLDGDFPLQLKLKGEQLPERVTLVVKGKELVMESSQRDEFTYTFKGVKSDIDFYFSAAGYRSEPFRLITIERPSIETFVINAHYPAYTGKKDETLTGLSQIVVPNGTRLDWQFKTKNTDQLQLGVPSGGRQNLPSEGKQQNWSFQWIAHQDTSFRFFLSNQRLPSFDSLVFHLKVITDQSPQIMAQQHKDSLTGRQVLITGSASDDYGLSRLNFAYQVLDAQNKEILRKTIPLQHKANTVHVNFDYYFDINTLHLQPGQSLNYFVEAYDNDAVNGPKRVVSQVYNYKEATGLLLDKEIKENTAAINEQMNSSSSQAEKINEALEKFKFGMLENQEISWEQQNNLKTLQSQQMAIKNQIDALKKRFETQKKQSDKKNYSQNLKDKQAELEKQLARMQDEKMSEMMKKLQEMMQRKDKGAAFKQLDQWQKENKLFKMDMERLKALMKQVEQQMKMEDLANKASDLAKKQEALKEKTEQQNGDHVSLAKEQEQLKKALDKMMQEEFADLEKANAKSETPQNLSQAKQDGNQAGGEMQQSQQQLQQNQNAKSSSKQQNAINKLNQMAASLSQMAGGMDMQMVDINIKAVRQLLTNLLRYSFAQEDLFTNEAPTFTDLKGFQETVQIQNRLRQNTEMIKDSLFSLSKKIFQLAPTVNKETTELTNHLNEAIAHLEERRLGQARVAQQYAMTNANNLALLLDESLRNMMQMQAQGGGSGSSGMPSPGSGKPGKDGQGGGSPGDLMKDIITKQGKMGKGLSELQKGNGTSEGGGEGEGQNGDGGHQQNNGQGGNSNSQSEAQARKLAQLAQQQAELKELMQDLSSMLNSQGNGQNAQLIKEIQKEMNRNEQELVNRQLPAELIKRQKEIMTRLLKAQDAIRNQEQDDKRMAHSGKDQPPPMPPELKALLEQRKAFLESYQRIPATLKPFYKTISERYKRQIGQ